MHQTSEKDRTMGYDGEATRALSVSSKQHDKRQMCQLTHASSGALIRIPGRAVKQGWHSPGTYYDIENQPSNHPLIP